MLAAKLPGLPREERPVVATMMVEILTTMLIVSARRPAEAKSLMSETKTLAAEVSRPLRGGVASRATRSQRGRTRAGCDTIVAMKTVRPKPLGAGTENLHLTAEEDFVLSRIDGNLTVA